MQGGKLVPPTKGNEGAVSLLKRVLRNIATVLMTIEDYMDDLPAPGETTAGFIQVPTNVELQQKVVSVRRNLGDLPDLPEKMNTIGVVLSYELFGLSVADTATVTGLTDEQVGRIRMLDAYHTIRKDVTQAIIDRDSEDVRDMFVQQSHLAANKMFDHMMSEKVEVSLVAARDVLDRGGFMPKQISEHTLRVEGGLKIEHIRRDNSVDIPTIEHKDVEDASS